MRELVECIAKTLVDDPEAVEVREYVRGQEIVVELRVAPDDFGKVIGKQGRTAQAMRTLIEAASIKLNERAVLEIVE
jgi:hypothetical protein